MRNDKSVNIKSFLLFFSTARWVIGKRHSKIMILASLSQIIFALLDILLLLLIGPLMISFSEKTVSESNFKVLGISAVSTNQILLLIVTTVLVKNIAGLLVQKSVIRSLAFRQAEVGTALVQASLFDRSKNGQLLHSTNLLQTITTVIGSLFGNLFRNIIAFIGEIATLCAIIIGLMVINTQIAIFSICFFYFFGRLIIRYIGWRQRLIGKDYLESERESLRSFSEIQLMGRELRFAHKDLDALLKLNFFRIKNAKLSSNSTYLSLLPRYLLEMIFLIGIFIIVLFLGHIQKNQDLLPILGLVVAAGYRILPSLNFITTNLGNFKGSIASLENLDLMGHQFGIRSTELKLNQSRNMQQKRRFSGDLHLENVYYQYPISKKTIFTDFNLIVKSGETLLIQGLSGTGKTTLISLATGSISPQQGRIFIFNGETKIVMDQNVTGISYLSQDVPLLDESFAYNIALEETSEKDLVRLKRAASEAGILDRILQSPMEFKTQIGENGTSLSAGERQRLGIARSLYSEPALLILDEPTANLDAVSENLIWETLFRIKGQFTILIVSHRIVPEQVYDHLLQLPSNR